MRFSISTNEMNYGMGMVTRAIAVHPVKQVYDGVLIETPDEGLLLTSTDGEMTIKARVNATVVEDGCAVMPAKLFGELMRRQSGDNVDISIDQNMRATIRGQGSNTNMAGMTAEDFPEVEDIVCENNVILPCGRIRDAISKVMFAVSTDESRKILTGILIETTATETRLIGLDGFRLALERIEATNTLPAGKEMISAIVPGRVMNELSKMLPDDDEKNVVLSFNASHIMMRFDDVRLYTTLLTGEFIDYRRILPDKWTSRIVIDRTRFGEAIDRCGLMAREGKNNLIYLDIHEELMDMTSTAERGDVHEEISVILEGSPIKIAFNARFLTDIIRNIDTDRIAMCFNSNVSPCMILPPEGNRYTFLVLPVRTFNR